MAEIKTVSGTVVTFDDAEATALESLITEIVATQSGSGTPSPSNVRPISGFSAVNISHSGADTSSPTITTIQLGQTVYGGSLNVTTGELTITHRIHTVESVNRVYLHSNDIYYWTATLPDTSINGRNIISSHFVGKSVVAEGNCYITGSGLTLVSVPTDQTLNTKALADAWCSENKPQFVYPLATPITVQLSATTVRAVSGVNTIWSDSGDVEVSYRVYEEVYYSGHDNHQYYGYIYLKDGTTKTFTNENVASESIEITETLYDPQSFRIGGGILPQLKIRFFKSEFDFSDVNYFTLTDARSDNPNDRVIYDNSEEDFAMWDIVTTDVEPHESWAYCDTRYGEWKISNYSLSNDGKFVDVTATKQLAFETEETTGFNSWYDNLYNSQSSIAIKDLMRYWWETYFSAGDPDTTRYVNRNINIEKCLQGYPGIRNFVVWLSELNGVYFVQPLRSALNDFSILEYENAIAHPQTYRTYQGGTLAYNGSKRITKLVIIDSSRGFRWETGNNDGLVYTITENDNPLIKGITLSDLQTVGTNLFGVISNFEFYDISFVAPQAELSTVYYDRAVKINIEGEDIIFVASNKVTTGCQRVMEEISSSIPSIVENGQITSGEVEASSRNYVLYQNNLTDGDVKYLTDGDYLIRTIRVTNLPNTGTTEGFYLIKRTAMNGNAYMLCYGFSTQKLYVGSYNSTNDTLTWIECVTDISGKQDVITGAITPYLQANATADRIIASDANGKLTVSAVGAQALYSAINNISGLTGGKIVVTSSAGGSFVTSTIDASDLFALYTNITGLTGGNRVVLTSSAGGSLITSAITGTDLSNTVNHVNDDLSTGYSMLSLADGNIASGTTFNFSRQFIIPESGLYYVHALARWSANATGTRVLAIHSSGTQEVLDDNSIYMFTSNMASPGNMTFIQHLTGLLRVTSDNKYFWIRGWQNSGSTLGTNFRVQFVKLTDSTSVIT